MALTAGFIGLGSQGGPIAHRILGAGLPLHVWGRHPDLLAPFSDAGAVVDPTPKAVGAACDVVGICVTADADVIEVVIGDGEGVLFGMQPGGVIAIHATVSPSTVIELSEQATQRGVHILDAPVSGGPTGAAAGTMTVMVGGEADALDAARPVLETFSAVIAHLGPVGSGQLMKLLNNNLCYANVVMSISALQLAESLGMDPAVAADVMSVSSGTSTGLRIVSDATLFDKATGPTSNVPKDVDHFRTLLSERGLGNEPMARAAASAPAQLAELAKKRGAL